MSNCFLIKPKNGKEKIISGNEVIEYTQKILSPQIKDNSVKELSLEMAIAFLNDCGENIKKITPRYCLVFDKGEEGTCTFEDYNQENELKEAFKCIQTNGYHISENDPDRVVFLDDSIISISMDIEALDENYVHAGFVTIKHTPIQRKDLPKVEFKIKFKNPEITDNPENSEWGREFTFRKKEGEGYWLATLKEKLHASDLYLISEKILTCESEILIRKNGEWCNSKIIGQDNLSEIAKNYDSQEHGQMASFISGLSFTQELR